MSFSWNTIGMKGHPVLGRPEQFENIESEFRDIADKTGTLSDDLSHIRSGRTQGFTGQAADAVGERIGTIILPLLDVPKVSSGIASVFDRHGFDLEALRAEAASALTRAQTNWNSKVTAENEVHTFQVSVNSLSNQISQLRCYCSAHCCCNVEGRRQQLAWSLSTAQSNLQGAQKDLQSAQHRIEESQGEWTTLNSKEVALNGATAAELENLPLWSLTDTGNIFSEAAENVWEWVCEAWDCFVEELLEDLYDALSTLLDWLDVAGIFLEWIPLVNVVYKAVELVLIGVKTGLGLIMVAEGKMTWAEFGLEVSFDALGLLVPGGRLIGKAAKGVTKHAPKMLPRAISKNISKKTPKRLKDIAGMDAYDIPGVKQMNDSLRRQHDRLYRWKKWPSYHPKPDRRQSFLGIRLQHLDKYSPAAKFFRHRAPGPLKVKKDLLAPAGKTYREWGSRRVEEFVSDNAYRRVRRGLHEGLKGGLIDNEDDTSNSYPVLVPCGF